MSKLYRFKFNRVPVGAADRLFLVDADALAGKKTTGLWVVTDWQSDDAAISMELLNGFFLFLYDDDGNLLFDEFPAALLGYTQFEGTAALNTTPVNGLGWKMLPFTGFFDYSRSYLLKKSVSKASFNIELVVRYEE